MSIRTTLSIWLEGSIVNLQSNGLSENALQHVLGNVLTSCTNKHGHVLVYAAIALHIKPTKIMGCVIPDYRV